MADISDLSSLRLLAQLAGTLRGHTPRKISATRRISKRIRALPRRRARG